MVYRFENASILIVDDMKPVLTLVSSLLQIFGFQEIITAQDAEEGFEKFCEYNPDLIITDWYMDPYDGIELAEKIRRDPRSPNVFVPIIMMTGYSHKIRVEKARDSGITEFLVKPFKAKDLYARVEKIIEKPRQFVDAENFFGPDRRRKKPKDYDGPRRREGDDVDTPEADDGRGAEILRALQRRAKDMARD